MSYPIRVRAGAVIIENSQILLVEFNDENGLHYNLPSGGVERSETVVDAAIREVKEEAGIDVSVGSLAFAYEYAPHRNENKYGEVHSVSFFFECKRIKGSAPKMSETPDLHQIGVKWIAIEELSNIILYPNIKKQILQFTRESKTLEWLEEERLDSTIST
ncbi:NUDIX domain-containing protein [Bacillus sp. 2205SS5-2]|uniref:NUDIX domain-containing protein n=1 Tax=Bacillus sp. 2205SS5-2 TaxID=3109031 RepID=UPI003003CD0F